MRKSIPMKATITAIVTATLLSASAIYAADGDRDGYRDGYRDGNRADCPYDQPMGKRMGKRGKNPMMRMFARLDLSYAQKDDIQVLVRAHRKQMEENRPSEEVRKTHRETMLAAITAENFDAQQITQLVEEKQANRQQGELERVKLQNAIFKILTPEQQEEFKSNFLSQSAFKRGHGRQR